MRAILMFQLEVTKSQDSVHEPQSFWRERRAEAVSNRGSFRLLALPLGQTGSPACQMDLYVYTGPWLVMQSGGARNTGKS